MPLRPAAALWPPVLLGSQFVFNIGFYAVVPFLAIFLRDDMLLSGGLIGLILGIIGATVSITSIVFAALGLHQARLCKHCEKGENFR